MLATGQRNRTEIKEVAVTHTILFYRATVPAEFCLPPSASQKFSGPFPLTMSPPMTLDRGLRDRDFSIASLLSLFVGALSSCQPRVSLKVLALHP